MASRAAGGNSEVLGGEASEQTGSQMGFTLVDVVVGRRAWPA